MLNKKETFELYTKIMAMREASFKSSFDFNDREALDKASKTLADVLILLRKNCKEDFYEWPDEV